MFNAQMTTCKGSERSRNKNATYTLALRVRLSKKGSLACLKKSWPKNISKMNQELKSVLSVPDESVL